MHHPFILTSVCRFKLYASCITASFCFCSFDNQMLTFHVFGAKGGLHHNVANCPCKVQNHYLPTRLTVFDATTIFLTSVSHLNKVKLYDIVWICMLILCCLAKLFSSEHDSHSWAPSTSEGPRCSVHGVKTAASEMLVGKRWLHLKGQNTGKTPRRRNGFLKETDFMGRNKLINYYLDASISSNDV